MSTTTNFNLDSLLQNDHGRKLFSSFLKEYNNSCDNLLTLYLICCCFQNNAKNNEKIEDRTRIKQILEKTYNACFVKNKLPYLSNDLKEKLSESLKRATYNETVFSAVKVELRSLLETEFFPKFIKSDLFRENFQTTMSNALPTTTTTTTTNTTSSNSRLSKKSSNASILSNNIANESSAADTRHDTTVEHVVFAVPSSSSNDLSKANIPNRIFKHLKNNPSSSSTRSSSSSTSTKSTNNLFQSKPTAKSLRSNNNNKSIISLNENHLSQFDKQPFSTGGSSLLSSKNQSLINLNSSSISSSHVTFGSRAASIGTSSTSNSKKRAAKAANMPPNPYHVMTKPLPVSAQNSEMQSIVSGDIYFGSGDNKTQRIDAPKKHDATIKSKRTQMQLSETDPQEFFKLLSSKLNALDANENKPSLKYKTKLLSDDHEQLLSSSMASMNLTAPVNQYSIDAQLEEHLSRVYNKLGDENEEVNTTSEYARLRTNGKHQQPHMTTAKMNNSLNTGSSKYNIFNSLLLKKPSPPKHANQTVKSTSSSKSRKSIKMNGSKHQQATDTNALDLTSVSSNLGDEAGALSLSSSSSSSSCDLNNVNSSTARSQNVQNDMLEFSNQNQHHFYKLTSTSKEVDIDAQHHHQVNPHNHQHHHHHHSHHHSHRDHQDLSHSKMYANKQQHDSSASIFNRVNDWLSLGTGNESDYQKPEPAMNSSRPKETGAPNVKTTVAYYLPGEDLAYISTFAGTKLRLSEFKQLITKKGNFRYFFKTKSDLLDEECIVFEEVTDESSIVPMFNNKVIAKIEKI